MNLRAWFGRLDRLQQTRSFKIGASIALMILALGGFFAYAMAIRPDAAPPGATAVAPAPTPNAPGAPSDAAGPEQGAPPTDPGYEATQAIIGDILKSQQSLAGVAIGVGVVTAIGLLVVWMGLGLTYLALGLLALLVAVPGYWFAGWKAYVPLFLGVIFLSGAFAALMRAARLLLSLPGVPFAIARVTLAEAVRLKLSAIFIVLLLFAIAALPMLLDAEQPLRYRVQSFLQYGTGGVFWLIAVLVVAFSVATVAFDQRDKTIWQTITKPVASWQYVLGKWLGVATLAAVLLSVSGAGVFLFTEFLRSQPAEGEDHAFIARQGPITQDRYLLETQVLSAREVVRPAPPEINEEQFAKNVQERVKQIMADMGPLAEDPAVRLGRERELTERITTDLRKSADVVYRSIAPGGNQIYVFDALGGAVGSRRPLIFRYKIQSGANLPDQLYHLTFVFRGSPPEIRKSVLNQFQTIELFPTVIDGDGRVAVQIFNGDAETQTDNAELITFPPDGLEISYAAGDYRANFFRVMGVLWVKLAFLGMLGVTTATFLSFPVSCMVSFTTFFAAEGARYLLGALDVFTTEDREGKTLYFNTAIAKIAEVIASVFKVYSDLRPTGRLVDGLLLSWGDVAIGTTVLALWTVLLFVIGSLILRRRELAVYSGN